MEADDDGFISNTNLMMKISKCKKKNLDELIFNEFFILFDKNLLVVRDWLINNEIKSDRKKSTLYQEELGLLAISGNKMYEKRKQFGNNLEHSIDKYSIVENSIDKYSNSIVENSTNIDNSIKGKYIVDNCIEDNKDEYIDDGLPF
jgi:hypothetical protein